MYCELIGCLKTLDSADEIKCHFKCVNFKGARSYLFCKNMIDIKKIKISPQEYIFL